MKAFNPIHPATCRVSLTLVLGVMILDMQLFAAAPGQALVAAGQPNIVVIMTDNQDYGDLGAYGRLCAEIPRLNAFASEGMQFMDFKVEPSCTPTGIGTIKHSTAEADAYESRSMSLIPTETSRGA